MEGIVEKERCIRWMANRTTLRSSVVDTGGIMGKSK